MTKAAEVVDEWLESRIAAWERGLEMLDNGQIGRGMILLDDCPPMPGDVSYADLFAEIRSRKS